MDSTEILHRLDVHVRDQRIFMETLYNESLYLADARPSYRADGRPARWALDLRRPLSSNAFLAPVCALLGYELKRHGINQVAGGGIAASLIVAGLVASVPGVRGGIVRDRRKPYGFREILEGSLRKAEPVALLDDILASGDTLRRVCKVLTDDGFSVPIALPIFRFGWRDSGPLSSHLIEVHPLATLHYVVKKTAQVPVHWSQAPQRDVVWEIASSQPKVEGTAY